MQVNSQRKNRWAGILAVAAAAAFFIIWFHGAPILAQGQSAQKQTSSAVFLPDGRLKLPTGFRSWVFIGGPLTPNGLNGGHAGFPEFHNVYVEARNLEVYQKTGEFPEGTLIVKELDSGS
jgi:hypothetical protein